MPLSDRLLDLLLVKRDELGLLLLLGGNMFLATLALVVSQIVAETLFLSAYGGDVLIYVYMVNGIGAVLAGSLYARLQGRFRAGLFELVVIVLFAVLFGLAWAALGAAPDWALIALMVFVEIFGTLIIVQAWNTSSALLGTRTAKRLVPVVSGFGTVAGIFAGLLIGLLAKPLGTVNLIGLVLLALVLMAALAHPLARRLCVNLERIAPQRNRHLESLPGRWQGALAVVGNRHLQLILAMTAVATLTSVLVDYQFKVFSQAHYTVDGVLATERLSTFYGQLQVVVSVLALALQFGMASRFLERFGIAMTLALLPAVILTGALGIVLGVGSYFAAATLSRSGDKVLKFSLYGATNQILFMALPDHLQKIARTLSNAIVRPATFVLAGLLLMGLTAGAGMSDARLGWLTAGMALVWIVLSITAERRYLLSLVGLLARQRIQFHTDKIEITDRGAIEQIRALFAADDPQRVSHGLALARRIQGVDLLADVVALTGHADARVRAAATAFLGEHGGSAQAERLKLLALDDDPGVRAKATQALFRLTPPDRLATLQPHLDSPDLAVRAVALSFFLASDDPALRRLGDTALAGLAASAEPAARLAALDAVMGQKAQTCPTTVLAALEDPVPEVCCRAVLVATQVNCPGVWGNLLQRLREDRLSPMMLAALGTATDAVVPQLRELLNDTSLPIRVRRQCAQILGRIGGEAARDALLDRLHRPLLTVPLDAARAVARIVHTQGAPLPRARIAGALDLLYADAYKIVAALADFEASPLHAHAGVATLVLQRRLRRVLETLFAVLSLSYPADVIELAVACLGSSERPRLEIAIEVLNQALEREDRRLVLPLIEYSSPAASLAAAGGAIGTPRRTAEEWIERWLRHDDPWRSTAALWTAAEARLGRLNDQVRGHLASDHAVVRETAALATWATAPPGERRRLLEPLRDDPAASIRQLVADLLQTPDPDETVSPA